MACVSLCRFLSHSASTDDGSTLPSGRPFDEGHGGAPFRLVLPPVSSGRDGEQFHSHQFAFVFVALGHRHVEQAALAGVHRPDQDRRHQSHCSGGGEIQNDEICLSPLSEQLVSVLCSQTSSNSVTGFKGHVISRAKNGHGHDPKLDSSSIEHGRVVLPRWSRALGGANQDRAYDPTPDSFRSQCRGRKEGETKDVRQSQAK